MKPYYDDGNGIVIYNSDCRLILPHLEPVDLVLTDPPYGTGERLRVDGEFVATKHSWDEWSSDWLDLIEFSAAVIFVPPDRLCGLLTKPYQRTRLMAWVSENPVCRNGVSPRYGIQPIVALGKSFSNTYALDWMKHHNNIQTEHPHEKPLAVMQWLATAIKDHGTILDPFMGSGTTLRAAKDLGRKCIGIEISREYCDIAIRRLQQEVLPL